MESVTVDTTVVPVAELKSEVVAEDTADVKRVRTDTKDNETIQPSVTPVSATDGESPKDSPRNEEEPTKLEEAAKLEEADKLEEAEGRAQDGPPTQLLDEAPPKEEEPAKEEPTKEEPAKEEPAKEAAAETTQETAEPPVEAPPKAE